MNVLPLPDQFQWTGTDDDRLWTVTGTQIQIFVASSVRQDLKTALDALGFVQISVVDHPPEVVSPPAIVIRPADPYQAPYTASGARGSAWALEVDLIVFRNDVDEGLFDLERLREGVCANLPANWRWIDFGNVGQIEISNKVYLKGTLGVATVTVEGLDEKAEVS